MARGPRADRHAIAEFCSHEPANAETRNRQSAGPHLPLIVGVILPTTVAEAVARNVGVLADARGARAEIGEWLMDDHVSMITAFVKKEFGLNRR